jgi:hypothetical protein
LLAYPKVERAQAARASFAFETLTDPSKKLLTLLSGLRILAAAKKAAGNEILNQAPQALIQSLRKLNQKVNS